MREHRYIADRAMGTVIYLSLTLGKPLLLEGEAGVGKTDVAKVLAEALDTRLIRLQCYEGLDVNTALYEWNYPKQVLRIKLEEGSNRSKEEIGSIIFSEEYLIRRPLLEAIQSDLAKPPVLLIDEVDRSDEEFEAFLLEVLSDFQITIPEIGTIKAKQRPYVILTSNRTRELHDALKRRCLYHWIDYPTFDKEYQILVTKVPQVREVLARQICGFMQVLRGMDFYKKPGIAETLDWASALIMLHRDELDEEVVRETMGCILKYQEDMSKLEAEIMGKKIDLQKLLEDYLVRHFGG
jgi:MoxR-like ATPase